MDTNDTLHDLFPELADFDKERVREAIAQTVAERLKAEDDAEARRLAARTMQTPDPYSHAQEIQEQTIAKGGTQDDALAAAFDHIFESASLGDPRVIVNPSL